MKTKIKNFVLDLLFPKSCFNCQKEGVYLCEDCRSTLEISGFHQNYSTQNLKDLYYPLPYQKSLIKNLIQKFKYEPFVKELAEPLACLIIEHFQLMENPPSFGFNSILIPVPLEKRRLKWRGFNQATAVAEELASSFGLKILTDVLVKTKATLPQMELTDEERKENIKGVFILKNGELIKNKKILLVDDVYTTGSTMEECARILKIAGATEIIGIVVARG